MGTIAEQQSDTDTDERSWFDEFGPMHEVWLRLERGMQIMLGVAVITMVGFLGESWGGDNIPYTNIMQAIFRVSWAFVIAIMTSPIILMCGLLARRYLPISRRARGRIYLVALFIMLIYCWSLLYLSAVDVIEALAAATGVEELYPR